MDGTMIVRPRVSLLTGAVSRAGGGVFEAVRSLARALTASGETEVRVFGTRDERTREDEAGWRGVPCLASPPFGPRSFRFSPAMDRAVQDTPADLVHVHGLWMHCSIVANRWRRTFGRPTMVSPHGMLDGWALRGMPVKAVALMSYEGVHLREAACIHALNAAELEAIRAVGLNNPVCVIANGVEPPRLAPATLPEWRRRLPAESRVCTVRSKLNRTTGGK